MADELIEVKIDDAEIRAALQRLQRRTGDLSPALKAIGEHLLRATEEHFRTESDPDGRPWKPLQVRSYHLGYRKRGKRTHTKRGALTAAFQRYLARRKILTDTHELRGSIRYQVGATSLRIGTNKPYGAIHQLGGKAGRGRKVQIPARPYLGIGAADKREIMDIIRDHLARAVSGQ